MEPSGEQARYSKTIKQYALLSQKEPHVEVHTRLDDGTCRITKFVGFDATFDLPGLDRGIRFAGLSDGVFDEPPPVAIHSL
jgi:hypothetical protein